MHHRLRTRTIVLLTAVGLTALSLAGCGGSSTASTPTPSTSAAATGGSSASSDAAGGPKVVASTSWVGAIAKMAGATDIVVIAPSNIQHPPDYDPKASDLAALAEADYILLAGFEGFAKRMQEAAGATGKVLTVVPDYDPAKVKVEVDKLASAWGTSEVATANVAAYTDSYNAAQADVQTVTAGKPQTVVSHAFVANWVGFAGYQPAAVFGPEPLTPGKVAELVALKPTLVFENVHMPGGIEVATPASATLVNMVNFPGDDLELMPVVLANAATIKTAVAG